MIFGIGAFYGGERDVSGDFIREGVACVGWDEQQAPPIYEILRHIRVGDIVYIKSHPSGRLYLKAVGIVEDATVQRHGDLGHGVRVRWLWHGEPVQVPYTPAERTYNVRSITLYEEVSPMVQREVLRLLFSALGQDGAGDAVRDRLGNNALVVCPACGAPFIVSAMLNGPLGKGTRHCPRCNGATAFAEHSHDHGVTVLVELREPQRA
jgi:hypothetical protein